MLVPGFFNAVRQEDLVTKVGSQNKQRTPIKQGHLLEVHTEATDDKPPLQGQLQHFARGKTQLKSWVQSVLTLLKRLFAQRR